MHETVEIPVVKPNVPAVHCNGTLEPIGQKCLAMRIMLNRPVQPIGILRIAYYSTLKAVLKLISHPAGQTKAVAEMLPTGQ